MADPQEITVVTGNIKNIAVATEKRTVRIPITDEELVINKDKFFALSKEIFDKNEAFKEVKQAHKEMMRPLIEQVDDLMGLIQNQGYDSEELCYLIDDQTMGVMNYVLESGVQVWSRKLTLAERQLTAKMETNILPIEPNKK